MLMFLTPRIGPTPLLLVQDGAVLRDVSESFAVVAPHVTAGVPHHLYGTAAACDRLSVDRARKVVDVHSVYHVPNVVQPKVPPLVAGGSYPLVLGRKGLENDVFVPLVVYCLSRFLEEVAAFVQNEKEVVRILPGLYLRVDEFPVARPSGLLRVAVVLLSQSLLRQLSIPRSIFKPLPLELLDGAVGGARCGEK